MIGLLNMQNIKAKHGRGIIVVPLSCFAFVIRFCGGWPARDRIQLSPSAAPGIVELPLFLFRELFIRNEIVHAVPPTFDVSVL